MQLPERRRNQERGQLPTHHVGPPVPEDARRGLVELRDPPAMIDGHDAIEGRVQGRGLAGFAFAQPGVGPVERDRANPRQDTEDGHRRGDQQRHSELGPVETHLVAVEAEPSEHDRHTDRGRQETAPHSPARSGAREGRHQAAIRAGEQDAAAQQAESRCGVQRHLRVGRDPVERRDAVEIADERGEPDRSAHEGQELGGERARASLPIEEEQGEAQQHEGQRRVDAHAAGRRCRDPFGRVEEEDLVDAEVELSEVLDEREDGDQHARHGAPARGHARPRRVSGEQGQR